MKEILLSYGSRRIDFAFDDSRFELVARENESQPPLTDQEIGAALESPIQTTPLEDLISPGQSVLFVVSDATRATGSAQIVHLVVRRLILAGIQPGNLGVIFATGIHRPVTAEEKLQLLTPFIVQRIRVFDHDAADNSSMIDLGMTARGTPVKINRRLKDFDHVIVIGAIGFHYFAGFTGGRKSICPGLASATTIEATHMLAMDFDQGGRREGVATGRLEGNPVHEECELIAEMLQPSFVINSVVDDLGRPVKLYAGHWREAHRQGCLDYLSDHSVELNAKRDLVIASCGGFPYDINLIQAHKTLDMAAYACREGGTIILLAECREGWGRPDFLKWFDASSSSALEARLRKEYEVNGQTAWALLTKAERFRVILVSELPAESVRLMRMTPSTSLEQALAEVGNAHEGYIMTRGATWLPTIMS